MICFAKFFSVIRHRVKRLLNYNRNIGLDKTKRLINHRSSKGPSRRLTTAITVTSLLLLSGTSIATAALPSLKTSNDGHFIIQEDGTPFFWLADDAWGLHSRLNLKDAERFLDTRKSQGFTVIHTWLASTWILQNLNGDEPFQGALNNANAIHLNKAFFEHIGEVIDLAEKKKLYLVLEIGQVLRKNVSKWWIGGFGSHGDHVAKAYEYGWRLAQILKKKGQTRSNLIWGLGQDTHPEWGQRVGDKNAANSARNYKELVQSMAEGLADATNGLPMNSRNSRADYSTTMMSFHVGATGPKGGPSGDPSSSSEWFHKDDWLDYNAHQSGRHDRYIAAVHQLMSADYNRSPTKPALETEVSYENQVIEGESGKQRYTAYHSRLHAYWAVFSGGAGHQYGNNNVWQFYDPSRFAPRGEATTHWATAIKSAGAKQMGYLRSLIESRPFLGRIPDQHLLSSKQQSSGHARLQATRADDGSYAFIYSTNGRDFDVNLDQLSAQIVNVWWYDPRTGKATYSGQLGASGVQNFDPPGAPSGSKASEGNDWVLVLDDTSRDFPAPGSKPPIIVDPTNQPPVASAGSDQTTIVPANASLQGEASDDGLPSGKLITKWSLVSGPGKVTFSDATAAKTTVSFSDQGRYVLRLSASDGKLSSSDEVTITVRDEPGNPFGTPANLKAVRVSSNQIDLQWDDVTGETSYVLVARSGGDKVLRVELDANANGFSHFQLAPDTEYKYKIRANRPSDAGGNSAWSGWLYVTTSELPSTINKPPVSSAGSDQTIFGTAIGLQGEVSDDGLPSGILNTEWSLVSGPGEVTFGDATAAITTVSFSDQGRYVLRLSTSDGELSSSDEVIITALDETETPFGTPANLKAVRVSSNQIDLQWDDVTGETSYLLIARSGGTRVLRIRLGANANSFSHSELSPKTTYTYKVRADRPSDEGGNSAWSDLLYITTTVLPPPPITNKPPVSYAGSDQTVTVPAFASLQGEVDDDGLPSGTLNTEWNLVSGPGEATFSDATAAKTTVSFSDQGRYVLRLSVSDGELSSSDEVTITVGDESDTPFGAPANLKAVRVSNNQIDLQWDDVTGETSYLLIARSDGARVLRIRLDANTNGFSHFKLSPETTYTYKVRADRSTDEGGKSDWSNLLYVTTMNGAGDPPPSPPPVDDAEIAFIMAHRGGAAEAPENTLTAFEHALRLGVNIEMDVHLTSDGVIVVIHKEKVDYTTNGKGFVRDMTLEQIKRLDAGSHFSRSYKGERIPTLEEVFDLFIAQAPDNVIMSIDTHAESASMYEPLIELLQRYDLFERTFIEVTDTRVGDALRLRDNRVQLAVWAPSNREIDAAIDYPHYQRIHTRSRYAGRVGDVHNADKTLIAFVNSDGDIKTIRNFDIDGINTDRPEQMLSEFDD